MEVKEEKRPLWGLDRYLHFVVLGLSILNLIRLSPQLSDGLDNNTIISMLVSLLGIIAFWLIHKKNKLGEIIVIVWCTVQFIVISYPPHISLDLSQGYLLPLGFNGGETSIYINVIALVLFGLAVYRIKNRSLYQKIKINPIDQEGIPYFISEVHKSYTFGREQKMLLLSYNSGLKSFALLINKEDQLDNSEKEYLLCVIKTEKIKKKSLKTYEFKGLGNATISITTEVG